MEAALLNTTSDVTSKPCFYIVATSGDAEIIASFLALEFMTS